MLHLKNRNAFVSRPEIGFGKSEISNKLCGNNWFSET
jgi:hypothetical protein